MNLSHWIVLVLFIAAFAAAVRYCLRHGICGGNNCASCKGGCGRCKAHGGCPCQALAKNARSELRRPPAVD